MREIFETLADELRRASAEGNGFVSLDDESLAILRKFADSANASADGFVDDVEEVKFVSKTEVEKVKLVKEAESLQ